MRIDRAGAPFLAGSLIPAAACVLARRSRWAVPFLGLAACMALFFRDPERMPPEDPDVVVAPADGRVVVAGVAAPGLAPAGEWQQVSVFLSPLDVHINRVPYGGELVRMVYTPGRFLPAYNAEAASENVRNALWVRRGDRTVVFQQVVGVLARRIVCRVQVGDRLETGQRFGLMKFGSRMDVFLPPSCRLVVQPGDRVRAGESVVGRWASTSVRTPC
ncbi:MAG: phosphatidylserine decarboxylase family protein [Luteitalea sp.]|nr:phosphatidylserine decarboxylase family protein [Luteitalea sp.]